MKKKIRVLVAIPCYNCAPQIGRMLGALDARLLERLDEIIVIDNQSTDGTIEAATLARGAREKIRIFSNARNYGLGGTFKLAMRHSLQNRFDALLFVHGDAQAKIQEINDLLDKLQGSLDVDPSTPPAAIFGARFMRESRLLGYSKSRELANRALNLLFSLVLGRRIPEIGSGLNLYWTNAYPPEMLARLPDDAAFDVDLLLNLVDRKQKIEFVPITWMETDQISTIEDFEVGALVLKRLLRLDRAHGHRLQEHELEYTEIK